MDVYVLLRTNEDWESNDSTIIGVYSTLEQAQAAAITDEELTWYRDGVVDNYWGSQTIRRRGQIDFIWEIERHEVKTEPVVSEPEEAE